jgi:trans-2,3-dihydro-3-hydroxyanthranilate isomerase
MRTLPYLWLDVFSGVPFGGNQLAVYLDGRDLTDAEMQSIAREMNLSETTFVVPPTDATAHHRVRIFTPKTELPLAGHPTVGTTFALASEGYIPAGLATIYLQLGVGTLPVDIEREGGTTSFVWMHQPVPRFEPWAGDIEALLATLGLESVDLDPTLPIEVGSAGLPFLFVPLRDLAALGRARPGDGLLPFAPGETHQGGIFVLTRGAPDSGADSGQPDVRGRMFAPGMGISEDPATGAASGPLGGYLTRHTRDAQDGDERFLLHQGVEMGRPSQIAIMVSRQSGQVTDVRVGGQAVIMGRGELHLAEKPTA